MPGDDTKAGAGLLFDQNINVLTLSLVPDTAAIGP